VLAVSFLLGISADPNQPDRWNKTPMDDALRGIVSVLASMRARAHVYLYPCTYVYECVSV